MRRDESLSLLVAILTGIWTFLAKYMREWRKLGYSGEFSTSRKTPVCPDRYNIKKPPNFARFSENGCYMTYFESLLCFRDIPPRLSLIHRLPIHFDFSPAYFSLFSLRLHFSKTASPACGNFFHELPFFLALVALADSRLKWTLPPYAPFVVLFFLIIGIDSCNVCGCICTSRNTRMQCATGVIHPAR